MHHHDDIDSTTDLHKLVIITTYNSTKGGVDVVDQLCSNYNCSRNFRRWPMVILYTMLNIAGINSHVIYCSNTPGVSILRRNYLRALANQLILPHLKVRATTLPKFPRSIKFRLMEICGENVEGDKLVDRQNSQPGRCAYCDSRKNRKTRFYCFKCRKYMCLEHLVGICQECTENLLEM